VWPPTVEHGDERRVEGSEFWLAPLWTGWLACGSGKEEKVKTISQLLMFIFSPACRWHLFGGFFCFFAEGFYSTW
jgi:hypothetical protein